ncbi:MAG: hypothetical protein QM760_02235 [Nibricoccus sp.]
MTLIRRLAPHAWIAALAVALLFLAVDSRLRLAHLASISRVPGVLVQSPSQDPQSSTGYENGQRQLILPKYAIDGYHWLMQTQQMFANGDLRIRHVDYDNAPNGREVHWASPFRWWLGLLAWIDHQLTGLPIGQCVERAGLYGSPLLLALFLVAITPFVARRLGPTFATWLSLGLVGSMPLYDYFVAGNPDHHGAAGACALLTVLGLLAGGSGWLAQDGKNSGALMPADPRVARRWFALSAIAGALGLWISSASQAPVLLAVGIGAFFAGSGYKSKTTGQATALPALWSFWGRVGAAASLAAWLIEYFPSHLSWRLEVNHPLYALAWWGGGELLRIRWQSPGISLFAKALSRPAGYLALAAVIALPLTVLIGGESVFRISSRFLWALHHEYISEFQSVRTLFSTSGNTLLLWAWILPWLLLVPVIPALLKNRGSSASRSALLLAAAPTTLFALMAITQVRWMGFSHVMLLLLLGVFHVSRPSTAATRERRLALALTVGSLLLLTPQVYRLWSIHRQPEGASKSEIVQLATREVAHWLNRRTGSRPAVVATSPGLSTTLAYHGGAKSLGTLYWENLDGLETSAAFFGARTEADAWRIAQATGLTHLVLVSWSDFAEPYVKLVRGLKKDDPAPSDAFVLNLLATKTPPPWLRPVPCVLPANPGLDDTGVFVYEVVPPQSREESLTRLVQFLIDSENLTQATRFLPALEQYPQFLPAQIARARVQLLRRDNTAFLAAMRQLLTLSSQFPTLALEDRVQLALLLAVVGNDSNARREFSYCWDQAGQRTVDFRKLSPSALVYMLQQSARLEIKPPVELEQLARTLLPPQWLARL